MALRAAGIAPTSNNTAPLSVTVVVRNSQTCHKRLNQKLNIQYSQHLPS
jgi:hypothetical protein